MRILYQFPCWLQRLYRGVVWRMPVSSKVIYLTFDDGCIPEVTPQVLDILDRYGVKATFFCVGDNVRKYPDVFRRVVEEGHAVGNHTCHHLAGWYTKVADYVDNVRLADEIIDRTMGAEKAAKRLHLFRPPYGRAKIGQRKIVGKTHRIVLWDLLTHDYNRNYTPERILRIIRRYTRPGAIVVFHDSLKAQDNMLKVLPVAIEWWQREGYAFGKLDDC